MISSTDLGTSSSYLTTKISPCELLSLKTTHGILNLILLIHIGKENRLMCSSMRWCLAKLQGAGGICNVDISIDIQVAVRDRKAGKISH